MIHLRDLCALCGKNNPQRPSIPIAAHPPSLRLMLCAVLLVIDHPGFLARGFLADATLLLFAFLFVRLLLLITLSLQFTAQLVPCGFAIGQL